MGLISPTKASLFNKNSSYLLQSSKRLYFTNCSQLHKNPQLSQLLISNFTAPHLPTPRSIPPVPHSGVCSLRMLPSDLLSCWTAFSSLYQLKLHTELSSSDHMTLNRFVQTSLSAMFFRVQTKTAANSFLYDSHTLKTRSICLMVQGFIGIPE